MKENVLAVKDLTYRYGSEKEIVFKDLSLELKQGELLSIVGPSGCGKSTLLNLIAGFLRPTEGKIHLEGRKSENRRVGYIFQSDALLPWRKVLGNILLGLEVNGNRYCDNDNQLREVIHEYLDVFNLKPTVLEKYPDQLSGGMRQRIALIQSLMYDPDLLLLDEPFAALDFYTKLRLEEEFWNIVQKKKKSAILVTHDIDEAIAISNRILIMGDSPDGIVREFQIDFGTMDRSPYVLRGHPKFADYFNLIWGELKEKIRNG